jgi:predicted nucleotidyltransferase
MSYDIKKAIAQTAAELKAAGAKEVCIFGSAVTGAMSEDSDIDFAVAGLPPQHFFKAMSVASRLLGVLMDLIDLDETTPFTRYLKEEGELQRVA